MNEQSKAAERRKKDWRFTDRWFVGKGIDVGAGNDPMRAEDWPRVESIKAFDQINGDGNATYLTSEADGTYDFLVSSHCLEHLPDVRSALHNWARVLKPGGFMVVAIPEEWFYEYGQWPSRYNNDHKNSFTMRHDPVLPLSKNLLYELWKAPIDVELVQLVADGWDPGRLGYDQTMEAAESAIEFVARKEHPSSPW